MFNVEPQEKWTESDVADFEKHVSARHKKTLKSAAWASGIFFMSSLPILFSGNQVLNHYWEATKQPLLIAWMASLIWFVLKAGAVWASWQSARDTRREFGDPE
jgi:cytosine/uracil/thiamine/allantoin permease